MRAIIREAAPRAIPVEDTEEALCWEIVCGDHVVEMEYREAGSGLSRISIRTAVCCGDDALLIILGLARMLSETGDPHWRSFGTKVDVDVTRGDALEILRREFTDKRNKLLAALGLENPARAARRAGRECLSYLEGLRTRDG